MEFARTAQTVATHLARTFKASYCPTRSHVTHRIYWAEQNTYAIYSDGFFNSWGEVTTFYINPLLNGMHTQHYI